MPKVNKVSDMEIDEISFVDRPANQHAHIVLAKRADQEDAVPDFYDADGEPVDLDSLELGDVIQDAEGNLFEVGYDDEDGADEGEHAEQGELVGVGKSAFFDDQDNQIVASISDTLSKAIADDGERAALSKAFTELEKRALEAESRVQALEEVAKSERDLRLTREYIAKAAEYNVPIPADELGPVLMRCAENLSYEDCAVLNKALAAAGEMLFTEAGYDGQADNDDPMAQLDAFLEEGIAKSAEPISKAGAMTAFFDSHPDAYEAYRAERNAR